MPVRAYYTNSIPKFLVESADSILGSLARRSEFEVTGEQRDAWLTQIALLQSGLARIARGLVFFEFVVPRFGRRIDAVLLIDDVLVVIEFKVGPEEFTRAAREQVWDYALDLKNFHETSRHAAIVPVLVATGAKSTHYAPKFKQYKDGVFYPEEVSADRIEDVVEQALSRSFGSPIAHDLWEVGSYRPTPTIIEAAKSLYAQHSIGDLARSDASAVNLARTSGAISSIIEQARDKREKAICLVTGVPGAGKTLVGLDVATRHMDAKSELHSVYLSGNGPLVRVLREALTRDRLQREAKTGRPMRVGEARHEVEAFIQNVHHFRDDCLRSEKAPTEHVAIFDEAQRAWNLKQTVSFMARKKKLANFTQSEPAFLISCMNRHQDWAVIVCLIGGGQEINTGEAGIIGWVHALQEQYKDWHVYISNRLNDPEYRAESALSALKARSNVSFQSDLHLAVSMRSFRAESLSEFVRLVLELDLAGAQGAWRSISERYPIRLTRNLDLAKRWLKDQTRGSERYGIVVSSQAQRLKPLAIDVRVSTDPVHWFLDDADDVRSSYYLEDVATEFDVQGLELDWTCVVWDADFRLSEGRWQHHSFVGSKWNRIKAEERKLYLKNAYRVLLTRARQGMVLVVPEGSHTDTTRKPEFYDGTYAFLKSVGLVEL